MIEVSAYGVVISVGQVDVALASQKVIHGSGILVILLLYGLYIPDMDKSIIFYQLFQGNYC